jgi:tetratricopeptide (TPR) repeat protein
MLETVREYAAEQLAASGETEPVRERHLRWCLALAEQAEPGLRGPQQGQCLTRLQAEHDNLRAALAWAMARAGEAEDGADAALRLGGALARFWAVHGSAAEGGAWLKRALALGRHASAPARAKALLGLGWLVSAGGDFEQARASHEASLALHRELGDRAGMAAALLALAHLADYRGDPERARALLEESLELAQAAGDDSQAGEALCWLGRELYRCGEPAAASAALRKSAVLLRAAGDVGRLAGTLFVHGFMDAERGELALAEANLARSRDLYRQAGDRVGETHALGWLCQVAFRRGDYPSARAYLLECLERGRQEGLNELARWLCLAAQLERAQGDLLRARAHARESLALYAQMGCPVAAVRSLEVLGGLLAAAGTARGSEEAARLFGAAEARRRLGGMALAPADRAEHERDVALVRARLSQEAFERAWTQGGGTTLEQAVADALSDEPPD